MTLRECRIDVFRIIDQTLFKEECNLLHGSLVKMRRKVVRLIIRPFQMRDDLFLRQVGCNDQ
jgi:hypothetical protein